MSLQQTPWTIFLLEDNNKHLTLSYIRIKWIFLKGNVSLWQMDQTNTLHDKTNFNENSKRPNKDKNTVHILQQYS